MAGKLIAIEGGDGAGKATQTKMLVEYLSSKSDRVLPYSFPSYSQNFFGKVVKSYLAGDFGDFNAIPPKIASVLYACDRWESLADMKTLLDADYTLVCDRYVHSNIIYQCARVVDKEKVQLQAYIEWMEFNVFKMPRPNQVVYLDVPPEVSRQQVIDRGEPADIYEANWSYLQDVYNVGRKLSFENNWKYINCVKNNMQMHTKEDIHREVKAVLGY